MKRSEALKKLEKFLNYWFDDTEYITNSLMNMIEKDIGMLPPSYIKEKQAISIPTSDGPDTTHVLDVSFNEWEKE